jgi:hypothetical protein
MRMLHVTAGDNPMRRMHNTVGIGRLCHTLTGFSPRSFCDSAPLFNASSLRFDFPSVSLCVDFAPFGTKLTRKRRAGTSQTMIATCIPRDEML